MESLLKFNSVDHLTEILLGYVTFRKMIGAKMAGSDEELDSASCSVYVGKLAAE